MEYIIEGNLTQDNSLLIQKGVEAFNRYGIAIFPGLLKSDSNFLRFKQELSFLFDYIISTKGGNIGIESFSNKKLGEKLSLLNNVAPMDGKIITDLGTQPNKFTSFNRIKYSTFVDELVNKCLGNKFPIVTPQAGDTLHFFAPGQKFKKYNLPNHQDFPYLMQSPKQLTCYLGISDYNHGVGGLGFYLNSNKLNILAHKKNEHGSYEVEKKELLEPFEYEEYFWNPGDFAIFDSLLVHRSIPNTTETHSRIVQIFRFSSLDPELSGLYEFRSTVYERRSVSFSEYYPEFDIS